MAPSLATAALAALALTIGNPWELPGDFGIVLSPNPPIAGSPVTISLTGNPTFPVEVTVLLNGVVVHSFTLQDAQDTGTYTPPGNSMGSTLVVNAVDADHDTASTSAKIQ